MAGPNDITLVQHAVHNPDEPRHFMRMVRAAGNRRASIGDQVIVDSASATVVKEVGHDIYCLLYTSPSPRDATLSRMPSSA